MRKLTRVTGRLASKRVARLALKRVGVPWWAWPALWIGWKIYRRVDVKWHPEPVRCSSCDRTSRRNVLVSWDDGTRTCPRHTLSYIRSH